MAVLLLLTCLLTSANSAVLIINAASDEGPKARPHILFWGAALGLDGLIVSGGPGAIKTAMVIGALIPTNRPSRNPGRFKPATSAHLDRCFKQTPGVGCQGK